MLHPDQKQRFARHILLPEIGEDGQARLCAASVRLPVTADARAVEAGRVYLERAGMRVLTADAEGAAPGLAVLDTAEVQAIAGIPELEEAAAALCGAIAAVEAIKAALGVGRAAKFPSVVLAAESRP